MTSVRDLPTLILPSSLYPNDQFLHRRQLQNHEFQHIYSIFHEISYADDAAEAVDNPAADNPANNPIADEP